MTAMRDRINTVQEGFSMLAESNQSDRIPIPASPENVAAAKAFLLRKWKQIETERGKPEPSDLSNACRFLATFAAELFGGKVHGHDFHFWVVLPNRRRIDLNAEAADVKMMLRGEMPEQHKDYAERTGSLLAKTVLPERPYFPFRALEIRCETCGAGESEIGSENFWLS